jgi:hypothetical protein
MDEQINHEARKHEESVEDWRYADIGREMYLWFDRLNARFFEGTLPTPLFSFATTRASILGHYVPGRNPIGVQENVNINALHLKSPLAEVLSTLLHELIHVWQGNYGKPGRPPYHNKQCRQKMQDLGIPCDQWGHSLGMTDPLVGFLREHGVQAGHHLQLPREVVAERQPRWRLRRWRCGCTTVWANEEVHARCTRCACEFQGFALGRKTTRRSAAGGIVCGSSGGMAKAPRPTCKAVTDWRL